MPQINQSSTIPPGKKLVSFTDRERAIVQERFASYLDAVTIMARLRGFELNRGVQVNDAQTGFLIPDDAASIPSPFDVRLKPQPVEELPEIAAPLEKAE